MRVLVIEDQRMMAEALVGVLRRAAVDVTAVTGTADEAIERARRSSADVVLVDVERRGDDGVAIGRRLAEDPDVAARVVGLASGCRGDLVQEVLRAGFGGLLTRAAAADELIDDLRAVIDGAAFVQSRNAGQRGPGADDSRDGAISLLTPRELEVLRLLAQAATTDAIARRLDISAHTVRAHVQGVLTKLQVHSRLEAAAIGMRLGLAPRREDITRDGDGRRV